MYESIIIHSNDSVSILNISPEFKPLFDVISDSKEIHYDVDLSLDNISECMEAYRTLKEHLILMLRKLSKVYADLSAFKILDVDFNSFSLKSAIGFTLNNMKDNESLNNAQIEFFVVLLLDRLLTYESYMPLAREIAIRIVEVIEFDKDSKNKTLELYKEQNHFESGLYLVAYLFKMYANQRHSKYESIYDLIDLIRDKIKLRLFVENQHANGQNSWYTFKE